MKVLVSSINFAPDHAGIGLYSTDFPVYLAEHGVEVSMVTGFPYYPMWRKRPNDHWRFFARENYQGVNVFRGFLYVPERKVSTLLRLVHELTFCLFAAINFIRAGKHDAIVVFTPPFTLGLVGLMAKYMWRVPLIINVQDLPLDAALALGMLKPSFSSKVFQALENWIYRRADVVCSISPTMISSIADKGVSLDRLKLVPNWIDVEKYEKTTEAGRFITKSPVADGKFLVAYAGNIGIKQGIDVLLRVAKRLECDSRFHFFIIGDGADKKRMMALASELAVNNVSFQPFLNPVEYQEMLTDVDLMFVAQKSGAGNNFFPSKLLGLMARSKPLLVAADSNSELAKVITACGCGLVSDYEDVASIADNLLKLAASREDLTAMGIRGRSAVQAYNRPAILGAWTEAIQEMVSRSSSA